MAGDEEVIFRSAERGNRNGSVCRLIVYTWVRLKIFSKRLEEF